MADILQRRLGTDRTPPPGEEVMLALAVAAGDLGSAVESVLESHGLTHRQYNALRMLRGAGSEGLTHAEVGARLLVRAPDVTRLVDRLEGRGWVRRMRADHDRRVVLHRITPQGDRLLDELADPLGTIHRQVLELLGLDDARVLVELCERLVEGVARDDVGAASAGTAR